MNDTFRRGCWQITARDSLTSAIESGSLALVDHHGDTQSETFRRLLSAWGNYDLLMGLPPERARTIPVEASETHHFVSEPRTLQLLSQTGFDEVERFYGAFVTAGWLARRR